ncbi:hypothetical protein O181_010398 [Austropuccinia psidii MF-1]|uniref:NAD(+) kinase n=1 Tax=Austropuccinia psidii MF-1 TaxID=1389203 RepID=A0A9Q3BT94_9BASI|nr:hypothetical protein [Austropuccinia psidii MF-1]
MKILGLDQNLGFNKKFKKVLLIKKPNHQNSNLALKSILEFFSNQIPKTISPILEDDLINLKSKLDIDLVIALGGDGTILHISHLFKNIPCPPILGFNFGTIGFLLPFPPIDYCNVIIKVLSGQINTEKRMRLNCSLLTNQNQPHSNSLLQLGAINEIHLHRSKCPHPIAINISIQEKLLTQALTDGLIIATPTGSTAYSCSAGGPILYPNMQNIVMTPICPQSLSFRPVVLPSDLKIKLTLDPSSRSTAELAIDGIPIKTIHPNQSIEIYRSNHPIQLFSPCSESSVNDSWINDLNLMLNFNKTYQPKLSNPPKT